MPGESDDLVQQGHRCTVTGMPIRLELGVPGRPEQLGEAVGVVVGGAGPALQAAQPLLTHDDVAVGRHGAAVESAAGHVGEALSVADRRAVLGDFVNEHRPGTQGSRHPGAGADRTVPARFRDRKSTRLNSSHVEISYAVFCLKKKKKNKKKNTQKKKKKKKKKKKYKKKKN